jgi:thiol-disulfide isomerase/thioredoxin
MRLQSVVILFFLCLFLEPPFLPVGMCAAEQLPSQDEIRLYFFTATNCPHCKEIGHHILKLAERHPETVLVEKDIWANRVDFKLLVDLLKGYGDMPVSTPTIVLGDKIWVGVRMDSLAEIDEELMNCIHTRCDDTLVQLETGSQTAQTVDFSTSDNDISNLSVKLPFWGEIDPQKMSLPLLTVILGLLDSFNPCAFFVLMFLLSLLIHAHSRFRMLLVGLVFVTFSGVIYFLFMAAWLNLFLATGGLRIVSMSAGALAVLIGIINIKDFVFFRQGISLTLTKNAKSRLYERTRKLVQHSSYPALLGGTILLAIAANSYELLCTAGLPMVFTRILSLNSLPDWHYYFYLSMYNLVYILPLLLIVILFAVTLGGHKLSEHEGRVLKLISGVMMTELGIVLLFWPVALNNLLNTIVLIITALLLIGLVYCLESWHKKVRS